MVDALATECQRQICATLQEHTQNGRGIKRAA